MISVDFSMFVDRKGVMARVEKKRLRVLSRVGAFSRTVMRRSIRPMKRSNRDRKAVIGGKTYVVPRYGKVIDEQTSNPAPTAVAKKARQIVYARLKSDGAGKPPRRGPTDLLRKFIFFGIEEGTETVVIGPMMFKSQPKLVGVVSVPQLLEEGGAEYSGGELMHYGPHPFVAPTMPHARKKMAELIEATPL